jgi:hypothetical protein
MTDHVWSEVRRDEVYSELCRAITRAGVQREALYLSRLSLLLIEALRSRDDALRAIAEAEEGLDIKPDV